MKVLVTGGGGFLGTAIVKKLSSDGHDIISYSRGHYAHLNELGVTHYQGNLSQLPTLLKAMEGCQAVFHVAAKAGIWGDYQGFYEANVTGTENILRACKHLAIPHLIYTSTPSVIYHKGGIEGADETLPYPNEFEAAYPETKAIAEQMVLQANSSQIKTIALRPHLIWGPGDHHFLPRLLKRAKAGKLKFLGNEPLLVDCVYIDNAAEAHILAWKALKNNPQACGKAYFITQNQPIPIQDLVNGILQAAEVPEVTQSISPKIALLAGIVLERVYQLLKLKGEPPMTRFMARQLSTPHWFNTEAAQKDLGYQANISIEEGFKRLEQWIQSESFSTSSDSRNLTSMPIEVTGSTSS